jgi:DNA processing protein
LSVAFLLALHNISNMGNCRLLTILQHYGHDAEAAWQDSANWHRVEGLSAAVAETLLQGQKEVEPEEVYDRFLCSGASLLTYEDDNYPRLLAEIYDPPVLLFYYGSLPQSQDITVAMVGTRRPTPYGKQVAQVLARDIALQGIWVVSGMARGIDSICHRAALDAGGKTLAVLGCGVDVIYPPENRCLYSEIMANGAVISELPLGAAPLAAHFPMRNRLISGLSRGVVVVEAGAKSGTLLTVDRAMEQNRDVFAVPGPITSPMSAATNSLFNQGAKMVTSAQDIWQEYLPEGTMIKKAPASQPLVLGTEEAQIIAILTEPMHFDVLLDKLALPPPKLAAMLTMWEIRGLIRQLPGKYYVKALHEL